MDFVSEFVERYHGPTIHRSHGEEGNVLSPRHLRKMLQSPDNEFMHLFLGNECIKAGFCLRQGTTYRMYATGWLRGPTENLKGNMQCVAIWKALNRARELACDVLDLGGTPPFLDDGVFNFKMRWNARLNQSRLTYGSHCLLIDPAPPRSSRSLQAIPPSSTIGITNFVFCQPKSPRRSNFDPRSSKAYQAGGDSSVLKRHKRRIFPKPPPRICQAVGAYAKLCGSARHCQMVFILRQRLIRPYRFGRP
jgi:hypothetical protein